jgi:uncharacterized protein YfaS (alpha-2-macroglobulin family)
MNKIFLLPIALLLSLQGAFAQNDSLVNRNIKALTSYAAANPVEKVHLHLDRQLYFPGDTIWFKAYVVAGDQHQLSALSRILYAELIGPGDTLIRRLTLGLDTGLASGDLELPYNAAPGSYRIRAYTNWMQNAGPEYFYDQAIAVAAFSTPLVGAPAVAAPGNTGQSPTDKVDLQFSPKAATW